MTVNLCVADGDLWFWCVYGYLNLVTYPNLLAE